MGCSPRACLSVTRMSHEGLAKGPSEKAHASTWMCRLPRGVHRDGRMEFRSRTARQNGAYVVGHLQERAALSVLRWLGEQSNRFYALAACACLRPTSAAMFSRLGADRASSSARIPSTRYVVIGMCKPRWQKK